MQRMNWRFLLGGLVALAVLIAGCSNGNSQTAGSSPSAAPAAPKQSADAPSATPESKKDVSLRFSWWGGDVRHEATLAAIEAYKKIAPHVTIEAEYQGFDGYEQKVKTQLASSTAPDILQLDSPWLPELTKSDFFLDLSAQAEMALDGFDPGFLNNFSVYGGKTVALPTGINAYTLIINKTAAEKNGIPTDIEWSWDTLYEQGKALHEKDSSKYLLVADHNGLIQDFLSLLKQRTGQPWVNEDYTLGFAKDDALHGLSWLHKALKDGVYQPLGEADLYFGKVDQNPKWISQDIIMTPAMTSTLAPLKSVLPPDVEMTTALPAIDANAKDTAVVIRPSQLIAINGKSKNPEEAVRFLNWFMNDPEAAAILGDVRSTPVSAPAQKAAVEAGKVDATITQAVERDLAHAGIVDQAVATNSQVLAVVQSVIEKIAFDRTSPEEAADELIGSLQKKLKELQTRQ